MWYIVGEITPKMIVGRINRILKAKLEAKHKLQVDTAGNTLIVSMLPVTRIGVGKNGARLIVPIQGDSRYVIQLEIKKIDFGSGLLIDMYFAEITQVPKATYTQVTRESGIDSLYRIILCPTERKRLRATSLRLANMLFDHIDEVAGMQVPDFLHHSFVDEI